MKYQAILAFVVVNVAAAALLYGIPPFIPGILAPILSPVVTSLFGPYLGVNTALAILQSLIAFPILVLFIRKGWLGADEIG